ncbi:electron transfer flavoprotein subunit beta/FixA family protein [Paenibacillus lignilyticus]|uniref:Electron transfer flavoprotein subunit beta n=1 Tax=Paenibacillus lignilyticus TaxID=1172615 RepID=A0ABS5CKC8_9BACL|nr:electron transfer flavoprotein subunit beta/FixA family protein [Paenibacillus lignilyticus]MBP3966329.1 electron transfer flavoprotein subunit beta/FixA family protein [Paenibacillus lignilyticus]
MQVVVLMKQTFDTEEKIELVGGAVSEHSVKYIINPYDEYALEEALRLRDTHGGSVTVVSCGPERAVEALRTGLAMGADEAVHISDEGLHGNDRAIAAALAAVVKSLQPDLLLAGLFAVDRGAGSVALQAAELLGLPHASAALKVEVRTGGGSGAGNAKSGAAWASSGGLTAVVERDTEWGLETVEVPLPALITAQQGLNEPRYPSLPGIMKAKRKPLKQVTAAELGLGADDLAPRTERVALLAPPVRAAGRKLAGTPGEQAAALADLLQREAKLF